MSCPRKITSQRVAEEPVLPGPMSMKPIKSCNIDEECVGLGGSGLEGSDNSNPEVVNLPETAGDMSEQALDGDVIDEPGTVGSTT